MKLIKDLGTERDKNNHTARWGLFLCPYCNEKVERPYRDGLRNKSCRCAQYKLVGLAHKTHGDCQNNYRSRLYRIWCNMKKRCYNPKPEDAKYYRDKGIKICDIWLNDYAAFKTWALSHGYKDNLTIDRIKSNKDYNPENCQWITLTDNVNKSRYTKLSWPKVHIIRQIMHNRLCSMKELADIYNVSVTLIRHIVQNKIWKETINYGCN